jgi:hypothetical protein
MNVMQLETNQNRTWVSTVHNKNTADARTLRGVITTAPATLWRVDPLLDNARNTRGQQYGNSVFFVRGRAVTMQRVRCDVTQQ